MLDEPANPCLLLTGLPRGGTTLTCELLNKLPDVRALDEPMDVIAMVRAAATGDREVAPELAREQVACGGTGARRRAAGNGAGALAGAPLDGALIHAEIERFAKGQRRSILERGVAVTKHVDGRVIGAKVADRRDDVTADGSSSGAPVSSAAAPAGGPAAHKRGPRARLVEIGEIPVDPPLRSDFTLAIKHPVAFTALLSTLLERFDVFAIVRNPLAVLASWESVPMAVRDGRLGLPAAVAPEIARRLDGIADRLERQLALLMWFYESYAQALPRERVIRYEDVIASGGAALAPVAASAAGLRVTLASRNAAAVYDRAHMRAAGRLLLEREGPQRLYYSVADVRDAMVAAGVD